MEPFFCFEGAEITIEPLTRGRRITVQARDGRHVERATVDTTYPDALIELLLRIKGAAYLCDEISRDEDRSRVERWIAADLTAFGIPRAGVSRARILDYGCGCGASAAALGRLFPEAEVVGVELDARFADAARMLAAHHGNPRITVHVAPSGTDLPEGLGRF